MTNRNNTIDPSRRSDRDQTGEIRSGRSLADGNLAVDLQRVSTSPGAPQLLKSTENQTDSIIAIVADVEGFARGWTGRIRGLIHRSSELVERESLLAGAIARLDQQKAEWTDRTAAKEDDLRDQSKRLTKAWLDVESARRKAIQGARVASTASNKTFSGPVVAAPVQPVGLPQPIQQPPATANISRVEAPVGTPASPAGSVRPNSAPVRSAPPMVNVNVPIAVCYASAGGGDSSGDDAFAHAEAATRQKIEEFKRMQRAIRSNRNK